MTGMHALVDKMSDVERGEDDELVRPVRILEGCVLVWQDDHEEEATEEEGIAAEGEVGPQPTKSAQQQEIMRDEWATPSH